MLLTWIIFKLNLVHAKLNILVISQADCQSTRLWLNPEPIISIALKIESLLFLCVWMSALAMSVPQRLCKFFRYFFYWHITKRNNRFISPLQFTTTIWYPKNKSLLFLLKEGKDYTKIMIIWTINHFLWQKISQNVG